jgi:hypothetical protein
MNRRRFLRFMGAAALGMWGPGRARTYDWSAETPLAASIRRELESVFGGLSMALDFRCINSSLDEEFRIQINADQLYPVASCFKAFLVLYYFLNMPPEEWDMTEYTPLYRMAVYSDNAATGVVMDNVSRRVTGNENTIEKFNNFLLNTVGIENGLHTWRWEGSPTMGLSDPRFAPSFQRVVRVRGIDYQVDNVFTAADLARGYDFLTRGEFFTQSSEFREAVRATKALLSIPAGEAYRSPIERVYPPGYMGKDGVLPAADVAVGRVIDDAGALKAGDDTYLIAFMSAGDSESTAVNVLRAVVQQIDVYERNRSDAG